MRHLRYRSRLSLLGALVAGALALTSCENPTEAEETVAFSDLVEFKAVQDPVLAEGPTGRFYTVTLPDNSTVQREYDWKTTFAVTLTLLSTRISDSSDLELPVVISSISAQVQQATGGIVVPPTGGDLEHYTHTPRASGSRFNDVGETLTIEFDMWYDLPNIPKEALITVSVTLQDDDGFSFTGSVKLTVG